MLNDNEFYTLKGYSSMKQEDGLTTAMEDYLEMFYRMHLKNEHIRIKTISEILHVKPSSASKMANTLKQSGYIEFEKYGQITVTDKGKQVGEYLLYRHNLLHEFFCYINHSHNELTLVEKIEHFIDKETLNNIKSWLEQFGGGKQDIDI